MLTTYEPAFYLFLIYLPFLFLSILCFLNKFELENGGSGLCEQCLVLQLNLDFLKSVSLYSHKEAEGLLQFILT